VLPGLPGAAADDGAGEEPPGRDGRAAGRPGTPGLSR